LEKYFNIYSDYCTIAIFLDPRFKLDFYVDSTKEGHEVANEQNESWCQLKRVFDAKYNKTRVDSTVGNETSTSGVSRIFNVPKRRRTNHEERSEIFKYLLQDDTEPKTVNPLEYLKQNRNRYPGLSAMARDYLAIPGTSTAS
jgi:hypothetical protein